MDGNTNEWIHGMTADPRTPSSSPPGALEKEFAELTPAFFGVLHNLVRRGVPIDLGQGMDHVHDFYLEAWPGVRDRFDSHKGDLRTFAISAFYRFARRRAVQALLFSRALQDVDWVEIAAESSSNETHADRDRVLDAFSQLPDAERAVITASFGLHHDGAHLSERGIATQLGLSVHRFREIRARALAELAVRLGERGVLSELEFRVAGALFVESRSIAATAEALELTEPQVRRARQSLLVKFKANFGSKP